MYKVKAQGKNNASLVNPFPARLQSNHNTSKQCRNTAH